MHAFLMMMKIDVVSLSIHMMEIIIVKLKSST